MTQLADVFQGHADRNYWGNRESVSGDGSTLAYTHNLRHELAKFLRAFRVVSMFDAPCGDFNWMRAVDHARPLRLSRRRDRLDSGRG